MRLLLAILVGLSLSAQAQVLLNSFQFVPAAAGPSSLLTNLVGFWRLDETSGSRADSSTNNRTLTDINTMLSGTGKIGNAADSESDDNDGLQNTGTWGSMTGDFTVSLWIKPESISVDEYTGGIVCYTTNESVGDWCVSASNGRIHIWDRPPAGSWRRSRTSTAGQIVVGNWYHVVAQRTSGTVAIWINNSTTTLDAGRDPSAGWGALRFSIGRFYASAGYDFDGLIDLVGLWNRALTADEIAALYNSGAGFDPTQ